MRSPYYGKKTLLFGVSRTDCSLVQSGRTISSVATEFGLANQTVRNWLKEAQDGPLGAAERERTLRRELARVKEERDILAKATAWFATETTKTPRRSSSS